MFGCGGKKVFLAANEIGPVDVVRHIADHKNNSQSHHNLCNISACVQMRVLYPLRQRTRAFHKMAGCHDVREGNHTQRKYTGY
jgi:hypothetical protein